MHGKLFAQQASLVGIKSWLSALLLAAAAVAVSGCTVLGTTAATAQKVKAPLSNGPRKIAVFFDGTANDDRSGTNVADLYELVADREDVLAIYIEGVGAKGKPIGMAMAWGIGHRVRLAYRFLAKHYRSGDQIYLFGFSRGAYSARILASMLYHAGLPATPQEKASESDFVDDLYDAFKGKDKRSRDRVRETAKVVHENRLSPFSEVQIEMMGLWDTVEALGLPNYVEDENVPNARYGDQLCNVAHAFHALSLDDNRAQIFTPILLTRTHLLADCKRQDGEMPADSQTLKQQVLSKVEEVYFPGAHADVGGGYEGGMLRYFSLNWIYTKATNANIFKECIECKRGMAGSDSHDPQGDLPWSVLYRRLYRSIDRYASHDQSASTTILMHRSVVDRLRVEGRNSYSFEYGGSDPVAKKSIQRAGDKNRFNACFVRRETLTSAVYELRANRLPSCDMKIVLHDGRHVQPISSSLQPQ